MDNITEALHVQTPTNTSVLQILQQLSATQGGGSGPELVARTLTLESNKRLRKLGGMRRDECG